MGPYRGRLRQIIEEDKTLPKKQRRTAKRILGRLKEEGFEGTSTRVRKVVLEIRRRNQEVLMSLLDRSGEAQVDFDSAGVRESGMPWKATLFVVAL